MDAREVARFLGVSVDHVYRLAAAGEIPSYRLGPGRRAARRFFLSEVEGWLTGRRAEA